ncbi:MAG: hypothetical protein ACYC09_13010 [Bacteroidota bacterium]
MARDREIQYLLSLQDDATRVYKNFTDGVSKGSFSIAGAVKSAGIAIGAAFTVDALVGFMKAAAESEANVARLDAALAAQGITSRNTRGEMLELSNTLMKKAAVDDDVITNVQATIVALTGDAEATMHLTPLVLDLARGLGMEAEEAAKLVAKTLEGTDAMSRYGIKIGETGSKQERLTKITEELTKKFAGQAEAFANTDMGRMESASIAIDNLQESLGALLNNVLMPIVPALTNTTDALSDVLTTTNLWDKSMSSLLLHFYQFFGMTDSYYAELVRLAEIENAAAGATDKKTTAVIVSAQETKTQVDIIKDLKKELEALTPGTEAYTQKLYQLTVVQNQYKNAVRESELEVAKLLQHWVDPNTIAAAGLLMSKSSDAYKESADKIEATTVETLDNIKIAFDSLGNFYMDNVNQFSSLWAESLGIVLDGNGSTIDKLRDLWTQFFTYLRNEMLEIAAQQAALAAFNKDNDFSWGSTIGTIGGSLIGGPIGGVIGNLIGGLFHDGGTVPKAHNGMFIDAPPSREFPILVRGGETIRTEEQEASLRKSSGITVIVNNYGPIATTQAFKEIVEKGMREIGVTDVAQYFKNSRSNLSIATA